MTRHDHMLSNWWSAASVSFLVLLVLLAACGADTGWSPHVVPADASPTAAETTLENRITPAREIKVTAAPDAAGAFDCAAVTQIPLAECAALVALYNGTNGPGWRDNNGWLVTNTPCTWTGVDCIDGHISHIYLSRNQLRGAIPAEFANLGKLTELDLTYNQLHGPLPESTTRIDQLMLWGNRLEGTIPVEGREPAAVDFMGVHFMADPSLATSIWPEVKPAAPLPQVADGPSYWLAIPEHIRFTFANPDLPPDRRRMGFNLAAEGEVLVFPLAELANMNPLVQTQIEALRDLLAEKGTAADGELPLLPLTNSAQVFHAQAQYFDLENIQGLRFISQHSQDPAPIMLSQELFYTFQGFTKDDAYYVAVFYPLTTEVLPNTIEVEDWEAFHANYDTYLSETTAVLDQLPPIEFAPDLTILDALATSLRIDPGSAAAGSTAYEEPVVVEPLPLVPHLDLSLDPLAGLIAYQQGKQLWLGKADLSGESYKLAECSEQDAVICRLPTVHWSADGSHFFYETISDGEYQLLISDLQGRQQGYRITPPPSRQPVWSPDGNKIVFFVVDSKRPWGDHDNRDLSVLEFGFI